MASWCYGVITAGLSVQRPRAFSRAVRGCPYPAPSSLCDLLGGNFLQDPRVGLVLSLKGKVKSIKLSPNYLQLN